jgi:hypothetical protein
VLPYLKRKPKKKKQKEKGRKEKKNLTENYRSTQHPFLGEGAA